MDGCNGPINRSMGRCVHGSAGSRVGWWDGRTDGWMDGRMDGWMDGPRVGLWIDEGWLDE